jgi:hypothetical protein
MGILSKAYLVLYNGSLLAAWGAVLVQTVLKVVDGKRTLGEVLPAQRDLLTIAQTAAFMEILHAMFKLVRSPVATTFLQVLSRLIVLWGALLLPSEELQQSWFPVQMIMAWAASEVIRYAFYVCNLLFGSVPAPLKWARYSGFTILYPLGISGEMVTMYKVLPYVQRTGALSVAMPNAYNAVWHYPSIIYFLLTAVWPPGAYIMYSYMLGQRRKALAGEAEKPRATSEKKAQ